MKPIIMVLVPMTLWLGACAQEPEPMAPVPQIAPEPVYNKVGTVMSRSASAVCPAGTTLTTGTDGNPYCVGS